MLNPIGERLNNWPWASQLVSGRSRILHKQPDSLVKLSRLLSEPSMITGSSEAKEFCHFKNVFVFSRFPWWLCQLPLSFPLYHLCPQILSLRLLLLVDASSCVSNLFGSSWDALQVVFKIWRKIQQALSITVKRKKGNILNLITRFTEKTAPCSK